MASLTMTLFSHDINDIKSEKHRLAGAQSEKSGILGSRIKPFFGQNSETLKIRKNTGETLKKGPHFNLVEESGRTIQTNPEKYSGKLGKILPENSDPGGKIIFSNYGLVTFRQWRSFFSSSQSRFLSYTSVLPLLILLLA